MDGEEVNMYVFIVPNVDQYVPNEGNTQPLPEVYGPYVTADEAVGSAIDLFRCRYDKEPMFTLSNFGEHAENIKLIIHTGEEVYLGATINKMD